MKTSISTPIWRPPNRATVTIPLEPTRSYFRLKIYDTAIANQPLSKPTSQNRRSNSPEADEWMIRLGVLRG